MLGLLVSIFIFYVIISNKCAINTNTCLEALNIKLPKTHLPYMFNKNSITFLMNLRPAATTYELGLTNCHVRTNGRFAVFSYQKTSHIRMIGGNRLINLVFSGSLHIHSVVIRFEQHIFFYILLLCWDILIVFTTIIVIKVNKNIKGWPFWKIFYKIQKQQVVYP